MSIKEMDIDGSDLVLREDHSLRTSMENLKLRDDCQREKHIRRSYLVDRAVTWWMNN